MIPIRSSDKSSLGLSGSWIKNSMLNTFFSFPYSKNNSIIEFRILVSVVIFIEFVHLLGCIWNWSAYFLLWYSWLLVLHCFRLFWQLQLWASLEKVINFINAVLPDLKCLYNISRVPDSSWWSASLLTEEMNIPGLLEVFRHIFTDNFSLSSVLYSIEGLYLFL